MQADLWKKVEALFQAALAQPPERRATFLLEACPHDLQLRREVQSLLDQQPDSFLESSPPFLPTIDQKGPTPEDPSPPPLTLDQTLASGTPPGAMIGPYRLLEIIGQGGMGEVWLAEQKEPVRRRVALKLIKAGMDTREVVARFASERQALALMDHPAIAKVFDAGSTPQGRPYFVMEYVAGMPITDYCDKHKLTTRERLELFIRVCEGVQHAHQKAVIHRDLKPSNILISEVDGKPVPKIIDFGVAKATAQRLTAQTMFTRLGSIVGTPEYMSPEQAGSVGEDIDTRTDVYSLGVVLYELLVGALPLDFRNLRFDEMLHKVRDEDAAKPSTKLRTLGEQSTTAAQNRRTEPRTLARLLRGDLDAITLKAIEKERSRRYGSPSDLAADIGRHLRNETVAAHTPSIADRTRKYIRRHWVGVAVAAAAALLLISFSVAQYFQLRRMTRERDRADRVTALMTSMFKVSNPSQSRGNKVTAREILDKASRDITTSLARDPELQAQMMQVMGTVYDGLGLYPQAESLIRQAVEIRRRVLGPDQPDTLRSEGDLCLALERLGRYGEAEKLQSETVEKLRRVLGPNNPDTLQSMNNLANLFEDEGRHSEAETLHRQTLNARRRILGSEHPDTLRSINNLARTVRDQHRFPEAEALYRQALEIERRVLGPDHPTTLITTANLADILDQQGHYAEAVQLNAQSLEVEKRVLGPDHPETLRSMNNLAVEFFHVGQYEKAEELFREVRDVQRRVLGPDHPLTADSTYNLACVAAHKGDVNAALALLREALDHGLSQADAAGIGQDPDLQSVHADPRFAALVTYAKAHAPGPAAHAR
jgi:non-specific serine/threonine protein kinase/serine/threonine-protein kinase